MCLCICVCICRYVSMHVSVYACEGVCPCARVCMLVYGLAVMWTVVVGPRFREEYVS